LLSKCLLIPSLKIFNYQSQKWITMYFTTTPLMFLLLPSLIVFSEPHKLPISHGVKIKADSFTYITYLHQFTFRKKFGNFTWTSCNITNTPLLDNFFIIIIHIITYTHLLTVKLSSAWWSTYMIIKMNFFYKIGTLLYKSYRNRQFFLENYSRR